MLGFEGRKKPAYVDAVPIGIPKDPYRLERHEQMRSGPWDYL